MATTKDDVIHEKYFHIDNGGFDFKVDKYGGVTVEFGFFGYSSTKIYISPASADFNVSKLAEFFTEAAFKLKEHNKKS